MSGITINLFHVSICRGYGLDYIGETVINEMKVIRSRLIAYHMVINTSYKDHINNEEVHKRNQVRKEIFPYEDHCGKYGTTKFTVHWVLAKPHPMDCELIGRDRGRDRRTMSSTGQTIIELTRVMKNSMK